MPIPVRALIHNHRRSRRWRLWRRLVYIGRLGLLQRRRCLMEHVARGLVILAVRRVGLLRRWVGAVCGVLARKRIVGHS